MPVDVTERQKGQLGERRVNISEGLVGGVSAGQGNGRQGWSVLGMVG